LRRPEKFKLHARAHFTQRAHERRRMSVARRLARHDHQTQLRHRLPAHHRDDNNSEAASNRRGKQKGDKQSVNRVRAKDIHVECLSPRTRLSISHLFTLERS
jgi:hypothetical protein